MQKNKRYVIFFFILLLHGSNLLAERTSGYCGLTEEEKGKEVLALNPHVSFHCIEWSNIRNKIWIDAWIKSVDLYDGIRLIEKAKIYDFSGKVLGKVTSSFNPLKILEERDTLTHIIVSGYLEKSCTDNTFIPENDLGKLLEKAVNNESIDFFQEFLDKYQFNKTKENSFYNSYLLVEPNFVTQTLIPRLLLVFYKNELIAIFHTRNLLVKRYDSIEMGSQYKMIYNSKFSEHTKMEMVDIYKNKLNKEAKNGN